MIKTSYNHLGWIATNTETGKTATSSFDEGEKKAIERCKQPTIVKSNKKEQSGKVKPQEDAKQS